MVSMTITCVNRNQSIQYEGKRSTTRFGYPLYFDTYSLYRKCYVRLFTKN